VPVEGGNPVGPWYDFSLPRTEPPTTAAPVEETTTAAPDDG